MKRSGLNKVLVAAVLTAAAIGVPTSAIAEPSPAPSPEVTRPPMEQFKFDRDLYLNAMKARSAQIRIINQNFKIACDKAAQDFKVAMSAAKTPDQKNAASNLRKSAINLAILTRDAAITALGAEPTPPVEPAKPMKIYGKSKSRN